MSFHCSLKCCQKASISSNSDNFVSFNLRLRPNFNLCCLAFLYSLDQLLLSFLSSFRSCLSVFSAALLNLSFVVPLQPFLSSQFFFSYHFLFFCDLPQIPSSILSVDILHQSSCSSSWISASIQLMTTC